MKSISLAEWINFIGVEKIANQLKVKKATVYHWRNGRVLPKDEHKRKIVALTNGQVSYARMIEDHFSR